MKITPLEIRQHEFEKTFRGYNIEEVDSFLSTLSQEWERVLNESKMLRMQLEIAEKEANKLREIEMTLFKTLKTAEDTSTMITDQATQQADKHVQEAKFQGEKIVIDAQQKAYQIVRQAEERARYIKEEVLGDVKILERDFRAMDHYKTNLLVQMRSLSNATLDHVQRFEDKFDKEGVEVQFKEATAMLTDEEATPMPVEAIAAPAELSVEVAEVEAIIEDHEPEIFAEIPSIPQEEAKVLVDEPTVEDIPVNEILIEETPINEPIAAVEVEKAEQIVEEPAVVTTVFASSVNNFVEQPTELQEVSIKVEAPKADELEIIEGIGPKIAMLLFDAGIFTFRDLATTPIYKIQEILEQAGPQFARHDPSTWTQQAKLAAEGRWEDLDALKFYLVGGREPKKDEVEAIVQAPEVVEEPIVEAVAVPTYIAPVVVPPIVEAVAVPTYIAPVVVPPIVEAVAVPTYIAPVVVPPIVEAVAVPTYVAPVVVETVIAPIVEVAPVVEDISVPVAVVQQVAAPVVREAVADFVSVPAPIENNLDSITEEMLEKVNKVKAAIRKAMVEKNDSPSKDTSPLPTVNDVIAKNESSSGGSFFDNL